MGSSILRSLRLTLRRLRRTDILGFETATFNPAPPNKKKRSCRYAHAAETVKGAGNAAPAGRRKKRVFKFGIEIPKTWDDILRLDGAASNKKWQAAVHKEVAALIHHDCFDFHSPDFRPPSGYQYVRLNLVYDVKADLTYKARLVCDGSRVDPKWLSTRATVVN